MQLRGRTALITGAARRVGRAIALRLAQEGCDVAVHYHTSRADAEQTARLCREAGVAADLFQSDLSDARLAAELPPRVLTRFGRLDILVNNASSFERMKLEDFSLEAWENTLRTNVTAPMILAHAARESLQAARGRIVNLCDIATQRPWPGHLAYIVSKGALETLTRALARAFAPDVNVIGIAPGVAEWPPGYDEATRKKLIDRIPLRRAGSPHDIAAAVHFVLAEGDYITGAILPIDGGRHVV